MRRVIAIIVGLIVGIAVVDLSWSLATRWFPKAIDVSSDADKVARYVVNMPIGGKLLVIAGWFTSGLIATFATLRISQSRPTGGIVAGLIVALCAWNLLQLVQPLWMQIASVVALLLGCGLAERHFHRARSGDPLLN